MYNPLDAAIAQAAERDSAKPTTPKDRFRYCFLKAVADLCNKNEWTEDEVRTAKRYCCALLSPTTRDMPDINLDHKKLIDGKFAFGMALGGHKLDANCMNGQHQSWFPALYEQARRQLPKWHKNRMVKLPATPKRELSLVN